MTRKTSPIWLCPAFALIFFSCAGLPNKKETPPTSPVIETVTVIETTIEETLPIVEETPLITEEPSPNEEPPPIEIESISESQPVEAMAQETPEVVASPPENAVPDVIPPMAEAEILAWSKQLSLAQAPVRPEKPEVPELIMGKGLITPEVMSAFLLAANSEAEKEFVENLAFFYIEESAVEGVNHDAAFAQMCLETGYLSFTGLVSPEQNNFCGLGAIGPGQPGEMFPDPRTGVRAHIQHLKAYATDTPLEQELVDPRYYLVRFGSSPAIRGLSGTWAADRLYAEKIANILERLYSFAYGI